METPERTEIEELRAELASLKSRVGRLESQLSEASQPLVEKAFRVIGVNTHYAEFGVYRGGTLKEAWRAAERVYRELSGGAWDCGFAEPSETRLALDAHWKAMRFFAFDSFSGLPETSGRDREWEVFKEGTYACTEAEFRDNLKQGGFPLEKLTVVPGFFDQTCVPETAERIGLGNVGIVHIDSDLYLSAKQALDFITPYLATAAIIIFDDWYQYFGHPEYGEQKAFLEWREAHPEWIVSEFQKEGAWRNAFVLSLRREESFRRRGMEPVE
jgi:hypothetical protein